MYRRAGMSMPFDEIKRLLELSWNYDDFQFINQSYMPKMMPIFIWQISNMESFHKASQKPKMDFRFLDDGFSFWNNTGRI